MLIHWGRVTHICVSKLTTIGSDNGWSPGRRQTIIWITPLGTNFSGIITEIYIFSFKKMHLKLSSGNFRPFCLCLNVLNLSFGCMVILSRIVVHLPTFFMVASPVLPGCLWSNQLVKSIGTNKLRPRQNGNHFADDIFLNENFWTLDKFSLKYVTCGLIDKMAALVQIMAWRRWGDKPLSEAMLVCFTDASLDLNELNHNKTQPSTDRVHLGIHCTPPSYQMLKQFLTPSVSPGSTCCVDIHKENDPTGRQVIPLYAIHLKTTLNINLGKSRLSLTAIPFVQSFWNVAQNTVI